MTERLTLMAVHAHPDDECMSTGGVLVRYAREGIRTVLVTATRGEEGEVVDPDMNPDEVKPKLGDVRTAELECACKHLEVEELHILGYRDSGMVGWKPIIILTAWPRRTSTRPQDAWCASSENSIRTSSPAMMSKGAMVTLDHIQVHRMTVAAFHAAGEVTQYPEHGLAPWQPSKLYYTAYPRSYILTRYEIMRAMGAKVPADRPDFDPNKVEGTPEELITTRVDIRDFYGPG